MGTVIKVVQDLLTWMFGGHVPPLVTTIASGGVAIGLLIFLGCSAVIGFGKVSKSFREDVLPIFYDANEKRRAWRRSIFADHVESQVRRLNAEEQWSDHRFAELEAEVEAEGRRTGTVFRRRSTLRHEKTLSRALERSGERLILLEGDPGAGKSVALRHLTRVLAARAMHARSSNVVIPLYINLKTIERPAWMTIDRNLIEKHVLKTLNGINDARIQEFLDDEFAAGVREGTWLFLFDSFDEIPDVLSATSADTVIREYANAIGDFLQGFNRCRGIVASRHFRGPGGLAWPRFRILALSDRSRRNLIRLADLDKAAERTVIGELESNRNEFAAMSRNPMFLGLMSEYMKGGAAFPENSHTVFEQYVNTRLQRDQQRVEKRFSGLRTQDIRRAAECAALSMAAQPQLGLSPSRTNLVAAMVSAGFESVAATALEALEFIKLARFEKTDADKTFTFAHRRFQEYFATCVVLRSPTLVDARQLLTDARWRETAVVLLQTQSLEKMQPLLHCAYEVLEDVRAKLEAMYGTLVPARLDDDSAERPASALQWPPLALHVLALLQAGYTGRAEQVPPTLRALCGRIVSMANFVGALADRKWAVEVAGIIPETDLVWLLRDAFRSNSGWMRAAAYQQVGRLREIPADVATSVRAALLNLFMSGRLRQEQDATYAHLMRIPRSRNFMNAMRLLLRCAVLDAILLGIAAVLCAKIFQDAVAAGASAGTIAVTWLVRRLWSRVPASSHSALAILANFPRITVCMWAVVAPWNGRVLVAHRTALHSAVPAWVEVLAILLLVSWLPFSIFAVRWGQFLAPWAAPFVYFSPLRVLANHYREFWIRSLDLARRSGIQILGAATIYVFGFAAVLRYGDTPIFRRLLGVWVAASILIFLYQVAVPYVRDSIVWNRVKRERVVSAHLLFTIVGAMRTSSWRVRFLQHANEAALIPATEENERLILDCAEDIEKGLVGQPLSARNYDAITIREALGFSENGGRRDYNMAVVEALALLGEKVRARRAQ
jgi:hypothetical protein